MSKKSRKRFRVRAQGFRASEVAEKLLTNREMQWLDENKAALEAYNRHIERDGVLSERLGRL